MKKVLTALVIIFLTANCAVSQQAKISLSNAMELALSGNIELREKRKNLGIAKNEIKAANKLKNPQFVSNILMGNIARPNSSQVGVMLPVEIAKRGVRKESAKINASIVTEEVKQYEYDLRLRIRSAYFDILQAKSDLKIMQERKLLLEDLLKLAQSKPKNSENYKIEVLQADVRLKKQLIAINKAKANVKTAQYNFNRVLNLENAADFYDTREESLFDESFLAEIQIPSHADAEKLAIDNRHDLQMARKSIDKSKKDVDVVKRNRVPDISVGGGYAFTLGSKYDNTYLTGAFVSANADLPVLYLYTPEIQAALLTVEKTELDYQAKVNIAKNTLKTNYEKFYIAKDNVKHYNAIIEESNEILKLSRAKYQKNNGSLMNLIINEHTHQEYLNEYVAAVGTYYNTYIEILREIGTEPTVSL